MKEIMIGDQKYKIDCGAITYVDYEEKFHKNVFEDLNFITSYEVEQAKLSIELTKSNPELSQYEIQTLIFDKTKDKLDEYIDCITKLCWICIYYVNPNIEDYDVWYRSLKRLSLGDAWISEVIALLGNCFR